MRTLPDIPPLPEDPQLRETLATIISSIGRCDRDALLEGKPFVQVMSDFDSILILEILLEVETEFQITTDDMLPTDGAYQPQEITNSFPEDLNSLMAYMRAVVARIDAARQEAAAAANAVPAAAETPKAPGGGASDAA
ncbi:acyl carrier protein [Achromobacter sp. AGC39]